MSLTETQQFHQLVDEKNHILITFEKNSGGSAIGGALALLHYFKNQGKQADIICPDFVLPKNYHFLPLAETISPTITDLQKFIISIDVKNTGLKELSYDLKNDILRVYLTTKQGLLEQTNVKTSKTDFKYDLIITLNTADLASLGKFHQQQAELFYQTAIVNIDINPANERFGQINLINPTASATAEIIFDLIPEEKITEPIATALLTSIIVATDSFKKDNIKPQTLTLASKLIDVGANREEIVKNLYHTRSVSALQLWGTALSHLQIESEINLAHLTITRDEFIRAKATTEDLPDIINELIINSPAAKNILLLYEDPNSQPTIVHGIFATDKAVDALEILAQFKPIGNKKRASFTLTEKSLSDAEDEVIQMIKKKL